MHYGGLSRTEVLLQVKPTTNPQTLSNAQLRVLLDTPGQQPVVLFCWEKTNHRHMVLYDIRPGPGAAKEVLRFIDAEGYEAIGARAPRRPS